MTLRILHVDPERGFSGGETQVLALATHLREAGHEILVAAHPGGPLAARLGERGLATTPLECRFGHDPRAGLALRAATARFRADVVHHHTSRALSLAPYVSRDVVQLVTRRMDYAPRGAGPYVRWLYGRMDAVIAISRAAREALAARGIDAARVAIVPSGVAVESFRDLDRTAARASFGIADDAPVVAIVASLHERKGHAVLLDALARLAADGVAPLCLAAGTGPEGDALQDRAQRLGVAARVRWLGQVADVRSVLAAADVVAMPSLAEGLGVAAIEAMAASRPVVASAVGGLPELIDDGVQGLLVPPGDAAALAAALRRVLGDAALRARLGDAGRVRAESFSTVAMARGTASVYERALAARRGS
ncbi:MAG: glycosyltransferase family 4 protein [Candidatus Binatia bacterium]